MAWFKAVRSNQKLMQRQLEAMRLTMQQVPPDVIVDNPEALLGWRTVKAYSCFCAICASFGTPASSGIDGRDLRCRFRVWAVAWSSSSVSGKE